jgi:NADPH-dependent F420 reductase
MAASSSLMSIAILGGTGREGRGLAFRWAKAGYKVILGSRSAQHAKAVAVDLKKKINGNCSCEGMENLEAANQADVIVVTVPFSAHKEILELIRKSVIGKLVVDVTVPLAPPEITKAKMPPAGSAAQEAQQILGGEVNICTAFQNIAFEHFMTDEKTDCDVLVTGSSKEARSQTLELVKATGFNGLDAGPIENSAVVEGLTSVLIYINRQYHSTNAGIKITGITN